MDRGRVGDAVARPALGLRPPCRMDRYDQPNFLRVQDTLGILGLEYL
jgi:hypothetical protein